jgi:DNA polymerase-1
MHYYKLEILYRGKKEKLILEVKDENLEVVAKECKEIMENSISLKVPLVVNWKSSKKWESI